MSHEKCSSFQSITILEITYLSICFLIQYKVSKMHFKSFVAKNISSIFVLFNFVKMKFSENIIRVLWAVLLHSFYINENVIALRRVKIHCRSILIVTRSVKIINSVISTWHIDVSIFDIIFLTFLSWHSCLGCTHLLTQWNITVDLKWKIIHNKRHWSLYLKMEIFVFIFRYSMT